MTDRQMQFITWLVTKLTDTCETIEEVRKMNEEIRKHAIGTVEGNEKEDQEEDQ